jgi:hypothetical protein
VSVHDVREQWDPSDIFNYGAILLTCILAQISQGTLGSMPIPIPKVECRILWRALQSRFLGTPENSVRQATQSSDDFGTR